MSLTCGECFSTFVPSAGPEPKPFSSTTTQLKNPMLNKVSLSAGPEPKPFSSTTTQLKNPMLSKVTPMSLKPKAPDSAEPKAAPASLSASAPSVASAKAPTLSLKPKMAPVAETKENDGKIPEKPVAQVEEKTETPAPARKIKKVPPKKKGGNSFSKLGIILFLLLLCGAGGFYYYTSEKKKEAERAEIARKAQEAEDAKRKEELRLEEEKRKAEKLRAEEERRKKEAEERRLAEEEQRKRFAAEQERLRLAAEAARKAAAAKKTVTKVDDEPTVAPAPAGLSYKDFILFSADIEGSGEFVFAVDGVQYKHGLGRYPKNVILNGKTWENLDRSFNLRELYPFGQARVLEKSGRGVISLEKKTKFFRIYVSDVAAGYGKYAMTIHFPKDGLDPKVIPEKPSRPKLAEEVFLDRKFFASGSVLIPSSERLTKRVKLLEMSRQILIPGHAVIMRKSFVPPFTITAEVKPHRNNVRFLLCGGEIIFNWNLDPQTLQVNVGDVSPKSKVGVGFLENEEWHKIKIEVQAERIAIFVGDSLRLLCSGALPTQRNVVGIYSTFDGSLELKDFQVTVDKAYSFD